MLGIISSYLSKKHESTSLAFFRLGFGLLMTYSIIRFWLKGWIQTMYIDPSFHFTFYGFEWVTPLGDYTYLLFFICGLSAFFVAIGYKYYMSIIIFFLSFTYIELMDKTTYLNHYYFVSILSFLMIFLPSNSSYSVDSYLQKKSFKYTPKWCVDSIKLLLFIVYFYSGLAKINKDWLFEAQPLKIWLTTGSYDFPLIGSNLMQQEWFHYFMSWGGMFYDLLIPFLLIYTRTRVFGFLLVIFFHLFTVLLFPIGMFPYIMIMSSLIFFSSKTHKKILDFILKPFIDKIKSIREMKIINIQKERISLIVVSVFFIIQFLFPFRYSLYPGELFWNEQGYRFSWRVMLMEKKGYTTFKVVNKENDNSFYIMNNSFLTELQERQMSFQPDFIIEYAHFLGNYYKNLGLNDIEIYADSYVALNGR
ncbi:HTTM domain-containing protein, partial [Flavobacteriaceae bacterium]|nr:HTTM domain-containing protein [Flavobacteriaceae bacterium]